MREAREHQDDGQDDAVGRQDGGRTGDGRDRRGRRVTSAANGSRRLPRAPAGRPHVITVRVTGAELVAITERAQQLGISRQRLMVETATAAPSRAGGAPMPATQRRALVAEVLAARRQVAGIANNVNQIARAAHAAGYVYDDLVGVVPAIEAAVARLTAAVEALENGPVIEEGQEDGEDG
ncbi:hypothetical protein GCM10009678_86530 [Actinomadura kijaniata]|uniref:Bacterial mobilisation domain-containing protein n=1 Tax=Actinomadura namibiensis TaxID=182080 RepID=A0A7W3QSE1_ACTNM|nr:MobC family plasmid mobilization relaxosome protein [Actinomadura namibiensis]MBA8957730.1 hypothetical protein [Actinomadura namibiensis]